ncbi:ABC transporter permease [Georgenia sp. Z1491]|uniref:ABC transporter permease n=1 Tax=Georgenia sp. Z1491 TaxID=3416707 RepID=UPI003CEB4C99
MAQAIEHDDDARASADSRTRERTRPGSALAPLAFGLIVLVAWEAASRAGAVDPYFLPAPSAILARVAEDLAGPARAYLWPTLVAAGWGSLLGAAVALPLGIVIASSTLARRVLEPYVAASQALPAVAVAPLLALWLGYGVLPVVVLCALMVFFPMLLGTVYGLTHIDPDVVEAARLDGAGGPVLLARILLPLAVPAILTGVRNGVTLSLTGAIVGEIVTGGRGLGMLLSARGASADTVGLFSILAVLCVLAASLFAAVGALQRHLRHRQGA